MLTARNVQWALVAALLCLLYARTLFVWQTQGNTSVLRSSLSSTQRGRVRLVASLTTSPTRLLTINTTLDSLLRQTRKPDGVLVNLPEVFQRTGESYNVPNSFQQVYENEPVEFFSCGSDEGPATKLVGALRYFAADEDVWIVTVDDDVNYPDCIFDTLEKAIIQWAGDTRNPLVAIGISGFKVPKWGHGVQAVSNRSVDVLEGYGAAAYHRSNWDGWDSYWSKVKGDKASFMSDDLILSNFLALKNIERRSLAYPGCTIKDFWKPGANVMLKLGFQGSALSYGAGNGSMHFQARYPMAAKFLLANDLWGLPKF